MRLHLGNIALTKIPSHLRTRFVIIKIDKYWFEESAIIETLPSNSLERLTRGLNLQAQLSIYLNQMMEFYKPECCFVIIDSKDEFETLVNKMILWVMTAEETIIKEENIEIKTNSTNSIDSIATLSLIDQEDVSDGNKDQDQSNKKNNNEDGDPKKYKHVFRPVYLTDFDNKESLKNDVPKLIIGTEFYWTFGTLFNYFSKFSLLFVYLLTFIFKVRIKFPPLLRRMCQETI